GTWTAGTTYSSPTHDSTGTYHQDVSASDLATVGHYQFAWTATGAGAGVSFGELDVFDPYEQAVLSLQDAKEHLTIAQATTTDDAELAAMVATIGTSIEGMTGGPLVNRVITSERAVLRNLQTVLHVRQRPLVSVTSVTSLLGN